VDLIATEPLVVGGIQRRRVVAQQQGGVIFSVDELQPCNQRTGSTVINQATTQRRPSAAIESSSHLARHRRKRIYSTLHSTTNKKNKDNVVFYSHVPPLPQIIINMFSTRNIDAQNVGRCTRQRTAACLRR